MGRKTLSVVGLILGLVILQSGMAQATENIFTITIKDHKFSPAELIIPANQRVKVTVENQDPTAEEFESYDLNREKVVSGGKKILVYLGPLKPGRYKYFGDFNPKSAQGTIVAQ